MLKHPALIDSAMQHRAALVHAALTLIQELARPRQTPGKGRLGSVESWAEVMGGILEAAGIDGFLGNLGSLYDRADTERAMWRELVVVWWATHRDEPVRVADLAKLCAAGDLMESVLGEGSETSQHIRLGRALLRVRERVFGEHRVESMTDPRTKRPVYRLVKVSPEADPGPDNAACCGMFSNLGLGRGFFRGEGKEESGGSREGRRHAATCRTCRNVRNISVLERGVFCGMSACLGPARRSDDLGLADHRHGC